MWFVHDCTTISRVTFIEYVSRNSELQEIPKKCFLRTTTYIVKNLSNLRAKLYGATLYGVAHREKFNDTNTNQNELNHCLMNDLQLTYAQR